ncbi:MAG: ABC transporter substrate-binding protein [Myxococcales bacterium]|nr:ABC transporter substrate-binding protein [Myxococcales bacterium]
MFRVALCVALLAACVERGRQKADPESSRELSEPSIGTRAPVVGVRALEPEGAVDRSATITVRLPSDPRHLNPLLAGDPVAVHITLGDVYEPLLLAPRAGGRPSAHLAASFSKSGDSKVWSFVLRSGVRFHDGSKLGVEDVKASFGLAKRAVGPLRGEFDDLLSIESSGPMAITLRFSEGRPGRAEAIASVPIVSAKSFAGAKTASLHRAAASRSPNGTGALQVTRFSEGEIELRRNPNYWGASASASRILYRVVPDRVRAIAELRAGTIDIVLGLPIDEAITAGESDESLTLVSRSMPAYTAAVFNTEHAHLHAGARSALARSFDRKSIVQELFRGHGDVAVGPFLPNGPRESPSTDYTEFVLEKARSELQVVFGAKAPTLHLLVPAGSRTMERLADIWAADLRGIVEVEIQRLDFGDLLGRVRAGDFDVALLSFTTSADVDLHHLFHSSEIGRGNVSRLADPVIDGLLEELRLAKSENEVNRLSHALGHQLWRHTPYAFLTSDRRLGIIRKDVGGVGDTAKAEGARYYRRVRDNSEAPH